MPCVSLVNREKWREDEERDGKQISISTGELLYSQVNSGRESTGESLMTRSAAEVKVT